jgi:hypothetical protein
LDDISRDLDEARDYARKFGGSLGLAEGELTPDNAPPAAKPPQNTDAQAQKGAPSKLN